jgi:hypothetical protein
MRGAEPQAEKPKARSSVVAPSSTNAIFPDGHINKKLAPGMFESLPSEKKKK